MSGGADDGGATNLLTLIGQLQEPPAPPPVSMRPETWGWAVLAMLLAAILAVLAWRAWRAWQRAAYRRAALAELAASGGDPGRVAAILRRTALAAYPRADVAGLTGSGWVTFLETSGGLSLPGPVSEALLSGPWRRDPPPSPELQAAAQRWVRRHRGAPSR